MRLFIIKGRGHCQRLSPPARCVINNKTKETTGNEYPRKERITERRKAPIRKIVLRPALVIVHESGQFCNGRRNGLFK